MTTATPTKPNKPAKDFAAELRGDVVAIRVAVHKPSKRKTMTASHRDEVAAHFQAESESVSGSKQLFPRGCKEIRRIYGTLAEARAMWIDMSLQYTEPGVRLIRKDALPEFISRFDKIAAELNNALAAADMVYDDILDAAKEKLGPRLFSRADYPPTFVGSASIDWSVYNFEPNEELLQLAPETYKREQQRVRLQFEQSVAVYEQECKRQMADLVATLLDKLTPADEGEKTKKFTEATTQNLRKFFDKFKAMGVFSDDGLNQLVGQAEAALGGITMSELKKDVLKQDEVSDAFGAIKKTLDTLLVDAPERSINLDDLED